MDEKLIFNGIDGATGSYLLPPVSPRELSAIAKGDTQDDEHLYDLKLRHRQATQTTRGVKAGIDPLNLSSAGWGIIFASDDQNQIPAIKEALGGLLELRRSQAGERYREFHGQDGYQQGESYINFLARHGIGPGPADPERVPYYLLIVGDPESIPFDFQYQLDVQYAVGRIHFESLDQYAQYAQSVVEAETGQQTLPRRAAFFGVQNDDDRATQLSATQLIRPLAEKFSDDGEWEVQAILGQQATKYALSELIGGPRSPALLFSASHGMGFPKDDPRQVPHQGALLCQDWPGPNAWREPIPEDYYFSANDVPPEANFSGSVAFHFACYGAGTPLMDEFAHQAFHDPKAIASQAFIARLPQRMLSHPRGGMQAVIGHVERAWGYSFVWEQSGSQLAVFESALKRMMEGSPVGYAMEYFNERYAELSTILSTELQGVQFGKEVDEVALAGMWTANNDARSYVILGDPAVRIPESQGEPDLAQAPQMIATTLKASVTQAGALGEHAPEAADEGTALAELDKYLDGDGKLSLGALRQTAEHGTQSQKARLLSALGDSYAEMAYGDRTENLKAAISVYQAALGLIPVDGERSERKQLQHRLANAFGEIYSLTGEPRHADHAEQAHLDVLETLTRDDSTDEWVEVNLSLAYLYTLQYRQSGETNSAKQALEICGQVVEAVSRQSKPLHWASTHYEMANLQVELLNTGGDERLRSEAIGNYNAALEVYSAQLFPYQFVAAKIKLGDLYLGQESGDRGENIELAIQTYESVREEIMNIPDLITESHLYIRLGDAYTQRLKGERINNIFLALAYFKQSLALSQESSDQEVIWDLERKIEKLQSEYQKIQ